MNNLLTPETCAEIDRWLKKYPADQKQSALLQALMITQKQNGGWLSQELIEAVADYLAIPRVAAFEVATFYSMYELEPVGRHKIYVCTSISCQLRGCDKTIEHLEKKLNIKMGDTTTDKKFTLKHAECLAACAGAPMMRVGDDYHENLTPEKIDAILAHLE
jgi:NADH-quinone oxidoreductase subunit E